MGTPPAAPALLSASSTSHSLGLRDGNDRLLRQVVGSVEVALLAARHAPICLGINRVDSDSGPVLGLEGEIRIRRPFQERPRLARDEPGFRPRRTARMLCYVDPIPESARDAWTPYPRDTRRGGQVGGASVVLPSDRDRARGRGARGGVPVAGAGAAAGGGDRRGELEGACSGVALARGAERSGRRTSYAIGSLVRTSFFGTSSSSSARRTAAFALLEAAGTNVKRTSVVSASRASRPRYSK